MTRWTLALLLLTACGGGSATATTCEDLCKELAIECGYAAYPTFESCEQGCAYNDAEGADLDGQLDCVLDAACDTFAIVECEHAYGAVE